MKALIISFIAGYALNWRLGRKYLYPILDRELDAGSSRFRVFINHMMTISRHWIAEARGLGHQGSALNCADC